MVSSTVNIHAAKSGLSRLIARVEKGERLTLARAGRPVAQLVPVARKGRRKLPAHDPLLNLAEFAVDGPGGPLTNADIDHTLYGRR
jgi:prevent-host-death family protein